MNVLVVGDGPEELVWGAWFSSHPDHSLLGILGGYLASRVVNARFVADLDEGLALARLDLVIVGGPILARGEALRRCAAEGLAVICLHPPGDDSEAYYQVALSREETGSVIIPYLPLRLHPGVAALRAGRENGEIGTVRALRHEISVEETDEDMARHIFPVAVDPIGALLGEIDSLTASGDPPGTTPELELLVQLRSTGGDRAEIRIMSGPSEAFRLTLAGTLATLTLEYPSMIQGTSRLIHRSLSGPEESVTELPSWDPRAAIMQVLHEALALREEPGRRAPGPSLRDGTRAMELSEAVVRSLRKGRTIDLHYEEISEEAVFKSIMTSTGCMLLLSILVVVPLALAGPAIGIPGSIYLAYAILPALVLFALFQFLRLGIRTGRHLSPPVQDDEGQAPHESRR
ncbi:hypothetical protein [Aquisphaera insulae]|uniref:hypothetical protein n=1 Tax=Aquisphaera insulae TaxID=2712864 RepID=UPI0013EC2D35|nr:hypothetical protein [Aquisphaera insulae]